MSIRALARQLHLDSELREPLAANDDLLRSFSTSLHRGSLLQVERHAAFSAVSKTEVQSTTRDDASPVGMLADEDSAIAATISAAACSLNVLID